MPFLPDGGNIATQSADTDHFVPDGGNINQDNGFVNKNDPGILLNALVNAFPGGKATKNLVTNEFNRTFRQPVGAPPPPDHFLRDFIHLPVDFGKDVVNDVKGFPGFLASTVATPGLSLADAIGPHVRKDYTPIKSLDLPIVGKQSSYQNQRQAFKQAGAGEGLSDAMPLAQWLLSVISMKKSLDTAGKWKENLTPEPSIPVASEPISGAIDGKDLREMVDKSEQFKNIDKAKIMKELYPESAPTESAPTTTPQPNVFPGAEKYIDANEMKAIKMLSEGKKSLEIANQTDLASLQTASQRQQGLGLLADLDNAIHNNDIDMATKIADTIKASPADSPIHQYVPSLPSYLSKLYEKSTDIINKVTPDTASMLSKEYGLSKMIDDLRNNYPQAKGMAQSAAKTFSGPVKAYAKEKDGEAKLKKDSTTWRD